MLLFTVAGIALYYGTDILRDAKNAWRWSPKLVYYYLGIYGSPIVVTYLAFTLFHRKTDLWKQPGFLALLLLAIGTFTLRSCVHLLTDDMLPAMADWEHPAFWFRIFQGIIRGFCILIPLTIYWCLVHRKEQPLYGFTLSGFDTKPYFVMLLIMVPLIVAASLSADFWGNTHGQEIGGWRISAFPTDRIGNTSHYSSSFTDWTSSISNSFSADFSSWPLCAMPGHMLYSPWPYFTCSYILANHWAKPLVHFLVGLCSGSFLITAVPFLVASLCIWASHGLWKLALL